MWIWPSATKNGRICPRQHPANVARSTHSQTWRNSSGTCVRTGVSSSCTPPRKACSRRPSHSLRVVTSRIAVSDDFRAAPGSPIERSALLRAARSRDAFARFSYSGYERNACRVALYIVSHVQCIPNGGALFAAAPSSQTRGMHRPTRRHTYLLNDRTQTAARECHARYAAAIAAHIRPFRRPNGQEGDVEAFDAQCTELATRNGTRVRARRGGEETLTRGDGAAGRAAGRRRHDPDTVYVTWPAGAARAHGGVQSAVARAASRCPLQESALRGLAAEELLFFFAPACIYPRILCSYAGGWNFFLVLLPYTSSCVLITQRCALSQ